MSRLWPEENEHAERLERCAAALGAEIVDAEAFVGGGSAPDESIPGRALAIEGRDGLLAELRSPRGASAPVVGYLKDGRLILDLRTVDPADDESLLRAVSAARDRIG